MRASKSGRPPNLRSAGDGGAPLSPLTRTAASTPKFATDVVPNLLQRIPPGFAEHK